MSVHGTHIKSDNIIIASIIQFSLSSSVIFSKNGCVPWCVHAQLTINSCYYGHRHVYPLCRHPLNLSQISGWTKAWFIYSIIQLSGLPLEPRCPDNQGSTVWWPDYKKRSNFRESTFRGSTVQLRMWSYHKLSWLPGCLIWRVAWVAPLVYIACECPSSTSFPLGSGTNPSRCSRTSCNPHIWASLIQTCMVFVRNGSPLMINSFTITL